jgi:uncharacterized HAD superfamily protein
MNKEFNIGIDIDGCLNNLSKAIQYILKRDFDIEVDLKQYSMLEAAGITNEEDIMNFWETYNEELLDIISVEDNAKKVLSLLQYNNCNLHILTARDYNVASLTEEWIKKQEIPYDTLNFNCGDKGYACQWKNCDVMIDDKWSNILDIKEKGIEPILFTRPYNKNVNDNNIKRVNNWNEIYKYINKKYL